MKRFIAFLDILGFRNFVTRTPLEEAKALMGRVFEFLPYAECLSKIMEIDGEAHPDETHRSVYRFSFSDSFVLATKDDSGDSLNSIIVSTAILTRSLFAQTLPVRGSIVCGEADFVPGSDHMIGTGVLAAVDLEKKQDWFGVALQPSIGDFQSIRDRIHPRVQPLIAEYDVPLKTTSARCLNLINRHSVMTKGVAINWRFNLYSHLGVEALLPKPSDRHSRRKHKNTLAFARHLRQTGQVETPHDAFWLLPAIIPSADARSPFALQHGDEY